MEGKVKESEGEGRGKETGVREGAREGEGGGAEDVWERRKVRGGRKKEGDFTTH